MDAFDLALVTFGQCNNLLPLELENLSFVVEEAQRTTELTGNHFDERIADALFMELAERYPLLSKLDVSSVESKYVRRCLMEDAERLRLYVNAELDWCVDDISISFNTSPVFVGANDLYANISISGTDYFSWIGPLLDLQSEGASVIRLIEKFLKHSAVWPEQLDYLLLTGEMAQDIPLQNAVRDWWQRLDGFMVQHSRGDVAQGAAIYSVLKSRARGRSNGAANGIS
jgi:hypothetical protein